MAHDITKYVEQIRVMEMELAELRRERDALKKPAGPQGDNTPVGMPEIQVIFFRNLFSQSNHVTVKTMRINDYFRHCNSHRGMAQ